MGTWPTGLESSYMIAPVNSGASCGRGVQTPGVANTKSAWVQLVAAAPFDIEGLIVNLDPGAGGPNTQQFYTDIGIGPEGSEFVVAANLYTHVHSQKQMQCLRLPLHVAKGQRISLRTAGVANTWVDHTVHMFSGGLKKVRGYHLCTTVGANEASSRGTAVALASGSKGAWVQLSAGVSYPVRAIALGFAPNSDGGMLSTLWLVDVGAGPAGGEKVVVADVHHLYNAPTGSWGDVDFGAIPVNIPAGTRIAVRGVASSLSYGRSPVYVTLYLFS
jgi:hypothetical protein